MKIELWRKVILAIEAAIPEYDQVNERVSLGQALKARRYAADNLGLTEGMIVLDAGIGPGTMSEILLSKSVDIRLVGLDASIKLLRSARARLKPTYNDVIDLVLATFEALPFKERTFQRIVSAYAFRDSRDRALAIDEFSRASSNDATFTLVDLGKPDSILKRFFITVYIRFIMPLIASWLKSEVIKGNPWRMIVPTYQALLRNRDLVSSLRKRFADVKLREVALGALVIIVARKFES